MGLIRLNRFLAQCAVASRRKADELIQAGVVRVNGQVVYELGLKIDPHKDVVTLKGRRLKPQLPVTVMFHKPRSVLTTTSDPHGRPTVMDYVQGLKVKLFPVGRLDWDSEGLLLLTNDGDLAQQVLHPSGQVTKTYLCKLDKVPNQHHLERLKKGVTIKGGKAKAVDVALDAFGSSSKHPWVRLIIAEGRKHQVKQMWQKLGFDVLRLKRVAIGQLRLGSLKPGQFKKLTTAQIQRIFQPDFIPERVRKAGWNAVYRRIRKKSLS